MGRYYGSRTVDASSHLLTHAFPRFGEKNPLTDSLDLQSAFDSTIAEVRKALSRGMLTADEQPATSKLETLESELLAERERALAAGAVNRIWFQTTIKWLVEWLPESELTLIAALGRIARAKPKVNP